MDQYNFNPQNEPQTRGPVPTFNGSTQYDYPGQPPVYNQFSGQNIPEIQEIAEKAFGKSLTGMIMSFFPILCFFSFFIASKGVRLAKRANNLAAQYGVQAGGKVTAAKVMGTIGKIYSIVMTVETIVAAIILVIYAVYFIFLIGMLSYM